MENSISRQNVNVNVRAVVTDPNVTVQYKTKVLQKNVVSGVNTLTPAMISEANTKYIIKYDYTLSDNITVPANCILEFDGGSISGAYTLTFSATKIRGNAKIQSNFAGYVDGEIDITWFGADNTGVNDISTILQRIINLYNVPDPSVGGQFNPHSCIYFPAGEYLISSQISLQRFISLRGSNALNTIIKVDLNSSHIDYDNISDIITHNDNPIFVETNYTSSNWDRNYLEIAINNLTFIGTERKTSLIKNDKNISWINKVDVHDCVFKNLDYVFDLGVGYWGKYHNNIFVNCNHCIVIRGLGNDNSITNNTFRGTTYTSVAIEQGEGINITGNDFSEAGYAAISLSLWEWSNISGNYFEPTSGGYTIRVNDGYGAAVSKGLSGVSILGNNNLNQGKYSTCCLKIENNGYIRDCILQLTYIDLPQDYNNSCYGNIFVNQKITALLNNVQSYDESYVRKLLGIDGSYTKTVSVDEHYDFIKIGGQLRKRWTEPNDVRRRGNNWNQRPVDIPEGFVYSDFHDGGIKWDGYFWIDELNCIHPNDYSAHPTFMLTRTKLVETLPNMTDLISYIDSLWDSTSENYIPGLPEKTNYNTTYIGFSCLYLNNNVVKPIYWTGTTWVDATGATV